MSPPMPCRELCGVLEKAYAPKGNRCPCGLLWDPKRGDIPRGFLGATGRVEDVRLVLVKAEPGPAGDYGEQESYGKKAKMEPSDWIAEACSQSYYRLSKVAPFNPATDKRPVHHACMRYILNVCWPDLTTLDQQLERTWITESVLCSPLPKDGKRDAHADIDDDIARRCRENHLEEQLRQLRRPAIVAPLGGKARRRMEGLRVEGVTVIKGDIYAATPRSFVPNTRHGETNEQRLAKVVASWKRIAAELRTVGC